VREGGILAKLYKRDGRGNANFRDLYASRLISVAADCRVRYLRPTCNYSRGGIVSHALIDMCQYWK
jgi:hypothetical protein